MATLIRVVSCLLMASLATAAQANTLPNGGFENGLQGWILSSAPDDKVFRAADGPDVFAGKRSGLLEISAAAADAGRHYAYFGRNDLPTGPGLYRFHFALRSDLTQGTVGAIIAAQKPAGENFMTITPGQNNAPRISGKTDWTEYDIYYRLPIPADVVIVQLQMNDAVGRVWFDKVSVEKMEDNAATQEKIQNITSPDGKVHARPLGEPARNVSPLQQRLIPDPNTGRPLLIINSCTSPGSGAALLVDYENAKTDVLRFPAGCGGWDFIELSPGKFLFESLEPLFLVPVDLRHRKVLVNQIIPQSTNLYAWQFTKGPDGNVYFGSYPTCHAYRYNPKTNATEDLGRMGPEGNTYVRFIGATSDGWLLSSVMSEKSGIAAYNLKDKSQFFIDLHPDSPRLITLDGIVYATIKGRLQQFDSTAKAFKDADLPTPAGNFWVKIHDASTSARKVLTAGDGAVYVLDAGKSPQKIWDLPLRGGRVVGMDQQDRVIGIRGQDYFVAAPMATTIQPIQLTQDAPPVGIHFIRLDPDGGVTGGPSMGQTLFRFDPARQLHQNTPQVADGNGEVYDGQWIGGKFYFVSYSGGELAVWDPNQPWDQWNNVNPKRLAQYNAPELHSLIRPQGGLTIGPDGRLYSGWSAAYGQPTGGISEYDIATNQARAWSSDLIAPEVSIGSVAGDDKLIYGVTSNSFNGLTRPAKPIQFFAFDPQSQKIIFKQELQGVVGEPKLIRVPDTGHIWIATNLGLLKFDRDQLNLSPAIPWPQPLPPTPVDCRDARDSHAWFAVGNHIVQLDDGDTPRLKILLNTPQGIQSLAAGDKALYFTQDTWLWSMPR
jgi:hypothetical protein